jgi:hypothetical protein
MDNADVVVSHIPNLNVFAGFVSKNTLCHSLGNNGNQMMAVSDWM